jgi:hypothetical protein
VVLPHDLQDIFEDVRIFDLSKTVLHFERKSPDRLPVGSTAALDQQSTCAIAVELATAFDSKFVGSLARISTSLVKRDVQSVLSKNDVVDLENLTMFP